MTVPAFPPDLFNEAVREFWETRRQQASRGVLDQGLRSAVTGGQHMNGFARRIAEVLVEVGIPSADIFMKGSPLPATLPGFFRATKSWDLIVVAPGALGVTLSAAIEMKSLIGPSFGNNYNNRSEEAIGNAVDFWTAYRNQAFAPSSTPWLGYLFLLEDAPKSRHSVRLRTPHYPVLPEFELSSYATRIEILCRRLVLERHYNGTCFLLSDPAVATTPSNYQEPAADIGVTRFMSELLGHFGIR